MAPTIPTTEPTSLIAGDTPTWTRTLADYPASEGWTLTYTFVQKGEKYTIAATASGDDYLVTIPTAESDDFVAGLIYWQARVSKGAEVYTVLEGTITVRTLLATINGGHDPRTQAQKAIDELKAALASYTGSQGHISEYEIAGRRMKFRNAGEIIALITFWERELVNETAAQRMAAGQDAGRQIFVRF